MRHVTAVQGAAPCFEQMIPFVKPALPWFDDMAAEISAIVQSGQLTKGSRLEDFEAAVAEHLQVKHAVAVSSCTSGLMLAYQGLKLSGEVIVPSFTFMATVSALVWAGARPVFVDVRRDTATVSVAEVEAAITPATTAVVAVHTFGNPADIDDLADLCRRRGLKLVFDSAHGFGTLYRSRPVGSQGDAQAFSLSPTKLVVAGEGGIVTTNDDNLANHLRIGREYGNDGSYDSLFAGMNARMPEINAVIGLHSLRMLDQIVAQRTATADRYRSKLSNIKGIECMHVDAANRCSYKDFSIVVESDAFGLTRDEVVTALKAENIDTRKYYAPPVHRHTAYKRYANGRPLPNTDELAEGSLSLPMGPHIDPSVVDRICEALLRIQRESRSIRHLLTEATLERQVA